MQSLEYLRGATNPSQVDVTGIIKCVGESSVNVMIPEVVGLIQLYVVCAATTAQPER